MGRRLLRRPHLGCGLGISLLATFAESIEFVLQGALQVTQLDEVRRSHHPLVAHELDHGNPYLQAPLDGTLLGEV